MTIKNEFLQKYFFHIVLWIVFTFSLAVDESELYIISKLTFLVYLITKTLILMVLVYCNLLYFYPKFFLKRKYITYSICILLLTVFVGFINSKLELKIREIRDLDNTELSVSYFMRQTVMAIRYVLTTFLLKATVDYYEQNEKIKRIEFEKNMAELNFLKAQVNPHFLFNTLNNLYALILEKSDKSAECVLKLADILKYIIGEGTQDRVSLKKEILLLENYIDLEKIRKPNADVRFDYDGKLENLQITPLLLLPFVENALNMVLTRFLKMVLFM